MAKKRKRKKGINPRTKGRRGERLLLEPLTKWWGFEFHRTPASGAWGTIHKVDELSQDIVCDDPNFPYDIEVKNCEGWHLEKLLTAPKNDIYQWWDQTTNQCAPDKRPMLCFRRNRHPFLVMTREEDTPADLEEPFLTLHTETEDLYIYTLDQLTSCSITEILEWWGKDGEAQDEVPGNGGASAP